MKTLFIGGIKSGKSMNAQKYILNIGSGTLVPQMGEAEASLPDALKPTYLATTEFVDAGMKERIDAHIENRADYFETLEEPLKIYEAIKTNKNPVLVECVSMWINNMFFHEFTLHEMQKELENILELNQTIVFVLNDVGSGIIPDNKLSRDFVDASGKLSQLIASRCDEVYHTIAGISTRIK